MGHSNLPELGQLMMIGIAAEELSPTERKWMLAHQPSGVIYFRRNVSNHGQLKSLSKEIVKISKRTPPLIGIDQEGGSVARLSAPFTVFPGNDYLGRIYQKYGSKAYAQGQARIMARELKTIGVNYNFTPVADIASNPNNPIIGKLGRSFGKDPQLVSTLVTATIEMYRKEKVLSCAKHFPGHGDTSLDSHKALPKVNATKSLLATREFLPFKAAIASQVPTIMTAHVVYPSLDPKRPATLSHKILNDLLRKKMKYRGIIVSDDLEMDAIAKHGVIEEAAIESILAGADLLLICKSLNRANEVYASLLRHFEKSEVFRKRARESLNRIRQLKSSTLRWMFTPWPLFKSKEAAQHQEFANRIKMLGDENFI